LKARLSAVHHAGFPRHNTPEIAKKGRVSTAAIYTIIPAKKRFSSAWVEQHRALVAKWLRKTIAGLRDPLAKPDLTALPRRFAPRCAGFPEYSC